MTDVGDGVELTFSSATGAAVTAVTTSPTGASGTPQEVVEDPAGSGDYPFRFVVDEAGMWRVTFTATGAVTATEHFWVFAAEPGPLPFATAAQLAQLFRPLSAQEAQTVTARLAQASSMLRRRWPDLDDRIRSGELPADLVASAAIGMVLRIVRNPGGLRAETVGPFRREYAVETLATDLAITAAEEALLGPPAGTPGRSPARTIRATPGLGTSRLSWWYGRVRRW